MLAGYNSHLRRPKCDTQYGDASMKTQGDSSDSSSPYGYPFSIRDWNKDYTINKPGKVVIFFYRDGCPHCEHMKPDYSQAVQNASKIGATLGYVNTAESQHQPLMEFIGQSQSPYDVDGVPTIVSYYNGRFFSKFGGQRTAENLLKWANGIGTADVAFVKR